MRASPITATIDLEAEGVAHGFLKLPYSHDLSAWGSIMIPITVARRGEGPTALLTGGNHGDEYEGPIALFDLAQRIEGLTFRGRVIIVPAMNYPAFQAARRTSPLDGGNLNRLFPGRPDGTPSEKIADFFQRHLLPLADFVLDFHSGGKTLDFVPFAACHVLPNELQQESCRAAMEAFGAPYSMTMLEIDSVGMYDCAAEEMGRVFVTTELGGGGTASARTAAIATRGVANFLKHAGILEGPPEPASTQRLEMPETGCFVTCENPGLLEFALDLGEAVEEGQVLARVHETARTGRPAQDYRAPRDGILVARHFPGLVVPGDCLAVIAVPLD